MERREFEQHPEDLEQVADWLRAQRPEVNALELDRIKQRARAQAMRGERRGAGAARPRRALSTAITVLALTVGLGGAFAIAGKGPPSSPSNAGSSHGSAAKKQYCPPKGDDDDKGGHHGKNGKKGNDGDKCEPPKPPKPHHGHDDGHHH